MMKNTFLWELMAISWTRVGKPQWNLSKGGGAKEEHWEFWLFFRSVFKFFGQKNSVFRFSIALSFTKFKTRSCIKWVNEGSVYRYLVVLDQRRIFCFVSWTFVVGCGSRANLADNQDFMGCWKYFFLNQVVIKTCQFSEPGQSSCRRSQKYKYAHLTSETTYLSPPKNYLYL